MVLILIFSTMSRIEAQQGRQPKIPETILVIETQSISWSLSHLTPVRDSAPLAQMRFYMVMKNVIGRE